MAEEIKDSSKTRVRSPGFPFIGLKKALARVKEFYDHEKRNWANTRVAVKAWGFNEASSGGKQTIAALVAYGLMQDSGTGDARQVRLSELALKILLDTRQRSPPERQGLIKEAALKPKLHKEIWDKYEGHLPSRDNLRHFLIFEHEPPFNENWVDHFIGEFLATLEFAGLSESGTLSAGLEDKTDDLEETEELDESTVPHVENAHVTTPPKANVPPPRVGNTNDPKTLLTQALVVSIPRNFRVDINVRGDELKKEDLTKIKSQFNRWIEGLEEAFEE